MENENRERFSELLSERAETAGAEDIAIMVYTSGTTGPPKGACLSHRYIINSVESLRQTIPISETDISFSYLPYCHVAERISGLYNRLYAGASAYFVDDLTRLGQYMLEVKPTVFASLPRFFEKIHARVVADVEAAPEKERERFHSALDVGRRITSGRPGRTFPTNANRIMLQPHRFEEGKDSLGLPYGNSGAHRSSRCEFSMRPGAIHKRTPPPKNSARSSTRGQPQVRHSWSAIQDATLNCCRWRDRVRSE